MSKVIDAVLRFVDEFTQPAQAAIRSIEQSSKTLDRMGRDISRAGAKITSAGKTITTAVTVPVVAGFTAAAKAAVSYEDAFTGVRKTVDASEEEFAQLDAGIKKMSTEMASSKEEIAGVMEAAGQLGVSGVDNLLNFTRTAVMLGDTTNLTADEAATALAKYANVTGMAIGDVDKLGSVVVDLGNNFATTEADIMNMAQRLSGAGAQIGLSEGEILGFATALSSVGIEAEMGGSAFSKAMIKMQVAAETGFEQVLSLEEQTGMSLRDLELMSSNDSKSFKALAQSLGLTAKEMNATITAGNNLNDFAAVANMETEEFVKLYRDDAPAALQAFIQGLGDTEAHGQTTIAMLQDMGFTEVRLRDTLTRLAQSGDLVTRAINTGNQAWVEGSALTEEAEKRYGTMASKLTQTKEALGNAAIELGNRLIPYMDKGIDVIEKLVDKFTSLSDEQIDQIIKWGAMAAAVGPALMAIGSITSGIGSAISMFGGFGKALANGAKAMSGLGAGAGIFAKLGAGITGFLGPAGIVIGVIAGLTAAGVLLYKNWDTVKEKAAAFKNYLADTFTSIDFDNPFGQMKEWGKGVLNAAGFDKIKESLATAGERIAPVWEKIKSLFITLQPVIQLIAEVTAVKLAAAFGAIAGVVSGVLNTIIKVAGDIAMAFGGLAELIDGIFSLDGDKILSGLGNILAGIFVGLFDLLGGLFETFANAFKGGFEAVKSIFLTDGIQSVIGFAQEAGETILGFFSGVGEWIADAFNGYIMTVGEDILKFIEIAGNIKEKVFDFLLDNCGIFGELIVSNIQGVIDTVENVIGGIIDFVTGVFSGDWEKAWQGIVNIVGTVFSSLAGIVKAPINAVIDIINKAIGKINAMSSGLPSSVADKIPKIPTISKLYTGTDNWIGGPAVINDRGGEIVDLPSGTRVYPHDVSVRKAREAGRNERSVTLNIPKLADTIVVREDSDIDRIAEALARKIRETGPEMA